MAVTIEQLADYIGADVVRDNAKLQRIAALASSLVDAVFKPEDNVSEPVRDEVFYLVAYNRYYQGQTNQSGSILGADGQTYTPGVSNDPYHKAWPLIKRNTSRV